MTLPSFHRPHDSGPIQWARGDVGLKPSAAARPEEVHGIGMTARIRESLVYIWMEDSPLQIPVGCKQWSWQRSLNLSSKSDETT